MQEQQSKISGHLSNFYLKDGTTANPYNTLSPERLTYCGGRGGLLLRLLLCMTAITIITVFTSSTIMNIISIVPDLSPSKHPATRSATVLSGVSCLLPAWNAWATFQVQVIYAQGVLEFRVCGFWTVGFFYRTSKLMEVFPHDFPFSANDEETTIQIKSSLTAKAD